jgi:hypothetical protein
MRPHHLWLAIALSISSPAFGASGSLETITTSEFLKLPEDLQNVYVAGVLDGMSYVTYNYEIADHDKFVACVRTQSLAATVAGVLDYIKNNPDDAKNPLPWSVTKAIGKLHC